MRRIALIVLRAVLGAVFLYAAYTKLREPWTLFAVSIDAYGILPEWAVLFIARTLPWFELALGLVLVAGLWLRYASIAAVSLLSLFFVMMAVAYAKGLAIDCGCFGPGEALSAKTLMRDGTLVAMAAALAVLSRVHRTAAWSKL
ncbi:MAG TPA: MauE/DoxX family redox-associated membrane protein [Bryobacteraceae bacterium]|nr:MauE/DoxX family redox-associated membrane protein [Bryobacteraceae bacterium]